MSKYSGRGTLPELRRKPTRFLPSERSRRDAFRDWPLKRVCAAEAAGVGITWAFVPHEGTDGTGHVRSGRPSRRAPRRCTR